MIYLISIIFIAELIILYQVAVFLVRADRAVCLASRYVDKKRVLIKWRMLMLKDISEGLNDIIPILYKKMKRTRQNIIVRILKGIAQSFILLFFKPKYKKLLIGTKTGIGVVRKLLKV